MNFTKARQYYRIRSALVIYGTALIGNIAMAVLLGWMLATGDGGGSTARGGTLGVLLAFALLVIASPVLFVVMLRAMFTRGAVDTYFKARVAKKLERSKVSGRIKSLRKYK